MKQKIINIPNAFTLLRLLLLPVVLVLFHRDLWIPALIVYVILTLTDAADGFLARMFQDESHLGRCFDSFSDMTVYYSFLIYLSLTGWIVILNLVLAAVVSVLFIVVLAIIAKKEGRFYTPHRISGKVMAVVIHIAIISFIVRFLYANYVLLAALVVICAYTVPDYLKFALKYRPRRKGVRKK